jgi:hypothetical protein
MIEDEAGQAGPGGGSRRAFLKGGAILAAPLAIAMPAMAGAATDEGAARLRRLEDEAAIRALHLEWLRRVNAGAPADDLFLAARAATCLAGGVCALVPEPVEAEPLALAADGRSARAGYACGVEIESRIAPDSTLAQMALAQGGGVSRRTERWLVRADYARDGERWLIAGIETRQG